MVDSKSGVVAYRETDRRQFRLYHPHRLPHTLRVVCVVDVVTGFWPVNERHIYYSAQQTHGPGRR
jgi:hypothetical protein